MLAFLRSQGRCLGGLDINPDEIRLLQLKKQGGAKLATLEHFVVENFAIAPLPPGAIVDGKIAQLASVQTIVTKLVQKTRTQGCVAAIALPAANIVSQRLKLAACLRDIECEAEISANLARYLPGMPRGVCFDFVKLTADADYQEILVVASPAEQVKRYADVAQAAGLVVKVVDVDAYALLRAAQLTVPLHHMQTATLVNPAELQNLASRLQVCCGLLMRRVG